MYLEILKNQPFWYNPWIWKYWRTNHSDITFESGNTIWPWNHGGGGRRRPGIFIGLCLSSSSLMKAAGVRLGKKPFWERVPEKMNMVILEITWQQAILSKWLLRPNYYAHIIGIKILCRTALSMSRDGSSESKFIGANSKYSFPAGMSTRSFTICPFHIFQMLFAFLWDIVFAYAQYWMDLTRQTSGRLVSLPSSCLLDVSFQSQFRYLA